MSAPGKAAADLQLPQAAVTGTADATIGLISTSSFPAMGHRPRPRCGQPDRRPRSKPPWVKGTRPLTSSRALRRSVGIVEVVDNKLSVVSCQLQGQTNRSLGASALATDNRQTDNLFLFIRQF